MDFNREFGEKDNTVISNIQGNIQNLSQQVQQLEAFIPRLTDSTEDGERSREQFNEMAQRAQTLSRETNRLMRNLVELSNSNRAMRVHRERLQNEYIRVLNQLQAVQRKAAQTEKASIKQARDAVIQDQEAAAYNESGYFASRPQQQSAQQHINLQEIKERQQALQQLEQDIGDVNQIFAELARIVHEQGDVVDSIEANVENAQIHVEQGAVNVQQAAYYNAKARQKKLLLMVFFLLLAFIIGLTIYLSRFTIILADDASTTTTEKTLLPVQHVRQDWDGQLIANRDKQVDEVQKEEAVKKACITKEEAAAMGLDQNGGFDDNQAAGNETTTLKNGFVFNDTTPFNGTEVVEEVAQLKIYKPLCDD
ncbi:hypothetical protein WR25_08415 [Diploscapter pachys]|uniref:t-SNARE coiled-coil homology domain-containing protein n=1 Tax=Diploscapter pachys TaxID=2018661 RepID=A0A2A2KTK3_9BILA|nr:hypothetical protein WR25_08415 [Diploscapter pachys]